jgi:hypothetical protein
VTRELTHIVWELEDRREELGFTSYSVAVEQLEDLRLKLIQTEERNIKTKEKRTSDSPQGWLLLYSHGSLPGRFPHD